MADLEEAGVRLVAEGQEAFDSVLSGVGDVVSGFGALILDVASAAGEAFVDFFADSFAGALEAEQTLARLGQVIESTGGIAGVTVGEAEALADEFKHLAGGSDDAVLSIVDMGLRMGTISEDEMPAFIQSTLDLAAVMGDASKASMIMARAQEDPVGTLGQLRKAGILVNEETEAQIKAMVKAGDTAGAYSLLMDRVGEATAGAAETMASTTAGQWAIFTETIADAGESIVGAFLPAINSIASEGLAFLLPMIEEFATSMGNVITLLTTGDFSGGIFGLMEDDPIIDFLFTVRESFISLADWVIANLPAMQATAQDVFAQVVTALGEAQVAVQPVIDAAINLATQFGESLPMIQATVGNMVDFVIGQFETLSPTLIANVSSTLNSLATFWDEHGATIMAAVQLAFEFISVTIGTTLTLVSGTIAAALELINGDWEGAWAIVQDTLTTVLDAILSIVDTDLESFVASWQGTFDLVLTLIDIALDNVVLAVSQGILDAIAAAQAILTGFVDVGQAIIDGMIEGIQNAASSLAQSAIDAVTGALDSAAAALGIQSPSRLAAEMIGEPIGMGIAEGIERTSGRIKRAVDITLDGVMDRAGLGGSVERKRVGGRRTTPPRPSPNDWSVFTDRIVNAIREGFSQASWGGNVKPPATPGQIITGGAPGVQPASTKQFYLNVETAKAMQTVTAEFATMQTLAGLTP